MTNIHDSLFDWSADVVTFYFDYYTWLCVCQVCQGLPAAAGKALTAGEGEAGPPVPAWRRGREAVDLGEDATGHVHRLRQQPPERAHAAEAKQVPARRDRPPRAPPTGGRGRRTIHDRGEPSPVGGVPGADRWPAGQVGRPEQGRRQQETPAGTLRDRPASKDILDSL